MIERAPPPLIESSADVLDDEEKKELLKYFELRDKTKAGSIPKGDIKKILKYLG